MSRALYTPRRARRDSPEQALHMAVAAYLRVALRRPTWWTTFPAGGGGRTRGAFLKAMGLKPGVPDLLVIHPEPIGVAFGRIVVWAELKSDTGRRSPDQVATHADLQEANTVVDVCRSVEEVAALLARHGIPLHARVMAGGGFMVQQTRAA
jgi:hypothetical protein